MFGFSNQILVISLGFLILCAGFIYYSMRNRINQVEEDMSSMFNLVSSLNEEQKRIGNLLVYSIEQQGQGQQHQQTNQQGSGVANEMEFNDSREQLETTEHVFQSQDTVINNVVESQEPKMIHLFSQNQEDMRLVVSDDEYEYDDEEEHEEDEGGNHMEEEDENETKLNIVENTQFNKMKVNELKELLETLDISKSDIASAKKLKKKELIEFIRAHNTSDVADTIANDDVDGDADGEDDGEDNQVHENNMDEMTNNDNSTGYDGVEESELIGLSPIMFKVEEEVEEHEEGTEGTEDTEVEENKTDIENDFINLDHTDDE